MEGTEGSSGVEGAIEGIEGSNGREGPLRGVEGDWRVVVRT